MVNTPEEYRQFPAYESHEEAQSDLCLKCHNSYQGAIVRKNRHRYAPGGRHIMHCTHCDNFVIYDLIKEVEEDERIALDEANNRAEMNLRNRFEAKGFKHGIVDEILNCINEDESCDTDGNGRKPK